MKSHKSSAFTLIELLVVMSIVSLLISILLPALASARDQARAVVCRSNIRQLGFAVLGYAADNREYFVPAASDLPALMGGLHRWHGVRQQPGEPFNPARGPLVSYLGDGQVKNCPQRVDFLRDGDWNANFERGGGGYGYNMTYLGSLVWQGGSGPEKYQKTPRISQVAHHTETLMFADSAMIVKKNNQNRYIEYSFAEPPFIVLQGGLTSIYASPSIHFRHHDQANIVWVDGHVTGRPMGLPPDDLANAYQVISEQMKLSWFEPMDNSLFDLQ
jgi:prepilin-type N-terminal cleavage/methylation domain-containing protein/prepilin-type processing-associated H-X9-DG protein